MYRSYKEAIRYLGPLVLGGLIFWVSISGNEIPSNKRVNDHDRMA